MCRTNRNRSRQIASRSAFTLVEMLVSVTLVLLMMTLFASIFQMATGTMGKQRGISEQNQRARALTTVIRKDLQHRTSRYPFAFYPGEDSATSPTPFSNRAGYFYLSTNDPNSGLDDLLQFTVSADILSEDPDATPFYGSTVELVDRRPVDASTTGLAISPNQPETDDGSVSANGFGSSPAAEISYYIRHGNLYRRVMLIREPLPFAGQNLSPQPTSASGYDYFFGQPNTTNAATYDGMFQPDGQSTTNDFYRLFDYSAYSLTRAGGLRQTTFLGIASLSNETSGAAADILANPQRRFGFNPATGLSREHSSVASPFFLGRFLQAETSTLNFNWPQGLSTNEPTNPLDPSVADLATLTGTNGNPLDIVNSPLALNVGNGLVIAFDAVATVGSEGRGGIRRTEDLLLANVHEMKIEMWDDRVSRYVTPGHSGGNLASGELGDYHVSRCLNPSYSPIPGVLTGTVFDTWHALNGADFDGVGGVTPAEMSAPYLPYRFYPPRQNAAPRPGPSPIAMTAPVRDYWQPGSVGGYSAGAANVLMDGSVVFAPVVFDGDLPTEVFEWPNTGRPPLMAPTADNVPSQAFQVGYVCISTNDLDGDSNIETSATPPSFPTSPGRRITDNEVIWESFDNRRPLKSIRLQIRFFDKTSDSMRQLSLVVPMTEVK